MDIRPYNNILKSESIRHKYVIDNPHPIRMTNCNGSTEGKWAKYAIFIMIGLFLIMFVSAVLSFVLYPMLGMSSMFVPLCTGLILFGFVYINREKFNG